MTDLDAALTATSVAGPTHAAADRRCKLGRILDTVTPAQRATILNRLHSDGRATGWSEPALSAALTDAGHPISYAALSLHKLRRCICTTHDEPNEVR